MGYSTGAAAVAAALKAGAALGAAIAANPSDVNATTGGQNLLNAINTAISNHQIAAGALARKVNGPAPVTTYAQWLTLYTARFAALAQCCRFAGSSPSPPAFGADLATFQAAVDAGKAALVALTAAGSTNNAATNNTNTQLAILQGLWASQPPPAAAVVTPDQVSVGDEANLISLAQQAQTFIALLNA